MSPVTNNPIHHTPVWKEKTEQTGSTRQDQRPGKTFGRDRTAVHTVMDTVEIRTPVKQLIESNRAGTEACVRDLDTAHRMLQEIIGMMDDGKGDPSNGEVHALHNRDNLLKILI
jgi:hypothetical protein